MTLYPPVPADYRTILSRAATYAKNTWWPGKGYPPGAGGWPTLANTEVGIRGAAMVALALSAAIHCDHLDYTVDRYATVKITQKLISSVARQHKANPAGAWSQWGATWQSGLWAALCAEAALLGWDALVPNASERDNVLRMLAFEADARLGLPPEFWKRPDGTTVQGRAGDSAAEENSWNAQCLFAAAAMLPDHLHAAAWRAHGVALAVAALSAQADCTDGRLINGRPVSDWCEGGFNVQPDGTLVNHSRLNPDYFTTSGTGLHAAIVYAMCGQDAPEGITWGAWRTYSALLYADLGGGAAYKAGSPLVNYPDGQPVDWGVRRPACYLAADTHMAMLGLDESGSAERWAALHAADVASMQWRPVNSLHPQFAVYDGNYTNPPEDSYGAREEWAMQHVAIAALAELWAQRVTWSDEAL